MLPARGPRGARLTLTMTLKRGGAQPRLVRQSVVLRSGTVQLRVKLLRAAQLLLPRAASRSVLRITAALELKRQKASKTSLVRWLGI